jgi:hypothetical protein
MSEASSRWSHRQALFQRDTVNISESKIESECKQSFLCACIEYKWRDKVVATGSMKEMWREAICMFCHSSVHSKRRLLDNPSPITQCYDIAFNMAK